MNTKRTAILAGLFSLVLFSFEINVFAMGRKPERQTFNIDFGPWKPGPSKMVGPAAAGNQGDFWNVTAVAWDNDHTEGDLKWANGDSSPITVRMINLAGGWGFSGGLGIKDPMMDDFNYPQNNQGGNSQVILSGVPNGNYDIYVYGHGTDPVYVGDYTLMIGGKKLGRKVTSNQFDGTQNPNWVEGGHYVKFSNVTVGGSDPIEVLIQPGGQVNDGAREFTDAIICGLQLIPVQ